VLTKRAGREGSTVPCPHLSYRRRDEERSFDHERPHCAAVGFVSPMRADACNDRYGFDHASHCDVYRELAEAERAADD